MGVQNKYLGKCAKIIIPDIQKSGAVIRYSFSYGRYGLIALKYVESD